MASTERKSVAIIGAGVSGITSAKAMLEQGFQPTIFDSKPHIGGLWANPPPSQQHPFLVSRAMRTNLSKFTCVFSDFSWKDAGFGDELPTFPRADDVATYLSKYWLKFAKDATLRLGCNVVKLNPVSVDAVGAPLEWIVEYKDANGASLTEKFDYVVFGTGFNSKGFTPPFAHQPSFKGKVLHASEYTWDAVQAASQATPFAQKKIVIVGGSLTAAELVGEIALSIASLPASERGKYSLIHLFSRPFWIAPKTLPLLINNNTRSSTQPVLFPMDWVFYDLKQAAIPNFNEYMKVLVGGDQSDLTPELTITPEAMKLPSWVCLSNAYSGFARSGAVNTVIGRLLDFSSSDPFSLIYDTLDGKHTTATIPDVSCVIMATGYTPYYTMQNFLSPELFQSLTSPTPGKPIDYTFLPFLLYNQVLHPSLGQTGGCVGLYKGPYFAVMELQAKWLAALFADKVEWPIEAELERGIEEMRQRRDNRAESDPADRGQWSWGDYIYIAQDICRTLGITWHPPSNDPQRIIDPFVPERLLPIAPTPQTSELQQTIRDVGYLHKPVFVPSAVFRALQGKWNVDVQYTIEQEHRRSGGRTAVEGSYTAQAMFAGEGRTDLPAQDKKVDPATVQELRYIEIGREPQPIGSVYALQQHGIVYRLDLAPTPSIALYVTLPSSDATTYRLPLRFITPEKEDDSEAPAWRATAELAGDAEYHAWFEYAFWFNGAEVKGFEVKMTVKSESEGPDNVQSVSRYRR